MQQALILMHFYTHYNKHVVSKGTAHYSKKKKEKLVNISLFSNKGNLWIYQLTMYFALGGCHIGTSLSSYSA